MGVQGLPGFIESEAGKKAIKYAPFSKFRGSRIAVDGNFITSQIIIAVGDVHAMRNKAGEVTTHLYGLIYKIKNCVEYAITPIFVFDGKSPLIKGQTLKNRSKIRKKSEDALKSDNLTAEERTKHFKRSFKLTSAEIKTAQILLDLLGVPVVAASGEADPVLCWLTARCDETGEHFASGVASDDSDMLPFGARKLFKGMLKFSGKDHLVTIFKQSKILARLNITQNQFIDMCVLMGCDYCREKDGKKKIEGIGPSTAYDLIVKHQTLENALVYLQHNGYIDPAKVDDTTKCLIDARNYYRTALTDLDNDPDFQVSRSDVELKRLKPLELIYFLWYQNNFNKDRVFDLVHEIEHFYDKMGITAKNTTQFQIDKPEVLEEIRQAYNLKNTLLSEPQTSMSRSPSDSDEDAAALDTETDTPPSKRKPRQPRFMRAGMMSKRFKSREL